MASQRWLAEVAIIICAIVALTPLVTLGLPIGGSRHVVISIQDVRVRNQPVTEGQAVFTTACGSNSTLARVGIGAVGVGGVLSAASPETAIGCVEFTWSMRIDDGNRPLPLLSGVSNFRSAHFALPLFLNQTRLDQLLR